MSSTTSAGRRRPGRAGWDVVRVAVAAIGLPVVLVALWLLYAGGRIAWTETQDRHALAPAGGRWLRAADTELHVRESGPAEAPVLLLVHGTGAWAGTWAGNVAAMQAAGFRVVAMDLPPFGFSALPASRDYSRAAQARRILAVAAQLGPQPVTLLAHSFGGGPALEAALLAPQRFRHLVLVDAAIGLQEPAQACTPGLGPLAWPGLRTLLVGALATEPAFTRFWLQQFVARTEVVTEERAAIYRKPFAAARFSAGLGDWAAEFAGGCERPASTQATNLRRLDLPVSLVWGDLDTITPMPQAHALQKLLPHVRLTVLRGVGHIPQIEDPRAFDTAVAAVLRERP